MTVRPAAPSAEGPPVKSALALQQKRAQILAGAGAVFLEAGYEGASMSDIARRAGVSKGALYNHFKNKADLFTAFFEERSRTKLNALEALSRDERLELRTALTRVAQTAIHLMLDTNAMGLYRILIGEAARFPHLSDTFWQYGFARTINNLSAWFQRKATEGLLHMDDPEFAAEQFMMLCQTRIVHRRRLMLPVCHKTDTIERIAHLTADSFLRIYGARPSSPHPAHR